MTEPAVVVNDLEVRCGEATLVGGIGFTLPAGQVLALVGASGSGKTTTGLALLGEYPHGAQVSGRVRVAGQTVGPGQPPRSGVVGYIPQHPSSVLNPVRRIGSVLREIAGRHDRPSRAVTDSLRRAQLPADAAFLRRYPHQLSGGQQQRLVLSQALIGNPTLIVADEPTTGQDTITSTEIRTELSALTRRGIAVVLLSHDLDLVRALADQIVVLHTGHIVEAGPAKHVLRSPTRDYTRALLAAEGATSTPPADHPRTPGLTVTNLTARHRQGGRGFTVVHPTDLDARPGECVAIVGRSGSGKTTLARCIAGLHTPAAGEVTLNGRPLPASLRRRSRAETAQVQYVFQDAHASFDEHRTVVGQVARTAVRLRGVSPAEAHIAAANALAEVGLPDEAVQRRPQALSGGELQRAALARALLARPSVLICDEITSGLDSLTESGILDRLDVLRHKHGLTVLLISHDFGVVARLADRVLVIHEGHVIEHGAAAQLLTAPAHLTTRRLLGLDRLGRPVETMRM